MATYYEEAAKEFDFNYDLETEDIPIVVNQGGKRTLLVLKLDIEAKIKAYLESSGILDRIEDLEKAIDDLEKVVDDLEKVVDDLNTKIEELEENGVGSGGSLDEDGNPRTSEITVYGYEGMTIAWTNSKGVSEAFVLDDTEKKVLTVTDLGAHSFKGTFGDESKTVDCNVEYYDLEYTVEVYIYDKKKLDDCTWAEVQDYAEKGVAKYVFELGDETDITTTDGIRTVFIAGFDYSPFKTTSGEPQKIVFATKHLGYTVLDRKTLDSHVQKESYDFDYSSSNFKQHFENLKSGFPSALKNVISTTVVDGSIASASSYINSFTGTCAVGNKSYIAEVFPPPVYAVRSTSDKVSNASASTVREALTTTTSLLIPNNGKAGFFGGWHVNSAFGATSLSSGVYVFQFWSYFVNFSDTHTQVKSTSDYSVYNSDKSDTGKGYDFFCFCIS